MFSLYFTLGMLLYVIIHLIVKIFGCKKCKKDVNKRQELFDNTDWTFIYNNPDIVEYVLIEAKGFMDEIYRDIIAIRDRALSIMSYLFITLGGLFYLFFDKSDKLAELHATNLILVLCGYITVIILIISIVFILPSKDKTLAKHGSPDKSIPPKNNIQDILEIKIDQILSLQGAIDTNSRFMISLRNKFFYILLELTCLVIFTVIYFLSLSFVSNIL